MDDHFSRFEYVLFDLDGTLTASVPGERHTKSDVIAEVFSRLKIKDRSKVLMVGDRKQDIEGAHKMGISAMGVLYGYGSREELEGAGAAAVAADLGELLALLCRNDGE